MSENTPNSDRFSPTPQSEQGGQGHSEEEVFDAFVEESTTYLPYPQSTHTNPDSEGQVPPSYVPPGTTTDGGAGQPGPMPAGSQYGQGAGYWAPPQYGQSSRPFPPAGAPGAYAYGQATVEEVPWSPKSKLAAGLFGIFLGAFGVHNFYLGFTGKAVAQLLITVLSFGILSFISMIWGLIEGILVLSSAVGTQWDLDAQGRPMPPIGATGM